MNNVTQAINNMTYREKKNKNGLLEGRLFYQGKPKSFYGHSKAEIKRKAKAFFDEQQKSEPVTEKITLNEYMNDWLENYKRVSVEPSTYTRMVSVYNHQIKEDLGKKALVEITSDDIQVLINQHAFGTNGKKPLAKSGLKKIQHLLRPCFEHAVKNELITKNPCDNVLLPKESNIIIKTKEQFAMSDEQIVKFKAAALVKTKDGHIKYRDGLTLVFMVGTGLRIGEALALKWEDVHIEENFVNVHNTLQTGLLGDEKVRIKDGTKTSDKRLLPLNENLIEILNMMKEFDRYHGIKSNYVCCTRAGTMHIPRNVGRSLDLLLERAGLPPEITPHTLRHTFGSALIRAGIGVEIVSRLMGHANIMITYQKYIHVIKEQETKAMVMVAVI